MAASLNRRLGQVLVDLFMDKARNVIEQVLHSYPQERERLRPYIDRIKAFSNDCGCAMGAAFMVGALILLFAYGFLLNGFGGSHLLAGVLGGIAFVFCASIAGKLTGIGLARIRLGLLRRRLRIMYKLKGD